MTSGQGIESLVTFLFLKAVVALQALCQSLSSFSGQYDWGSRFLLNPPPPFFSTNRDEVLGKHRLSHSKQQTTKNYSSKNL